MAPESLAELVFSSQSDVWSFGNVLWELFSLGKVPYPGFNFKQLIRELQDGYRMDKPPFATNEIGQLMSCCWKMEPNERPTFHQLQEAFSNQLETTVCDHYLSISDPYIETLL
jgi:serine/threonine protein kinase